MSSKQSKRAARDKLAAERKRQQSADKRRRTITNTVIAVVVAAVVVVVFVLVQNSRTSSTVADATLPAQVTEQGGGMVFGDGPVTVDLWEDFQCPACKAFEAANSEYLSQQVSDNNITMVIHPLSFLDDRLQNDSSVLAANAFGCSAEAGQTESLDYHSTLFKKQPPENPGTAAWSVDDLIGWGNDVGVSGPDWESCVRDGTYNDWVQQVAASQIDEGVTSTPSVFIDGERFNVQDDLAAAIDEAVQAAS